MLCLLGSVRVSSEPATSPVFKFSSASGRELTDELMEPLARETDYRFTIEATSLSGAGLEPTDGATGVELQPALAEHWETLNRPPLRSSGDAA